MDPQPSGSDVVNVKITDPFARSLAPGVYMLLRIEGLLKVPSPLVDHDADAATVIEPNS
jgi:hypothetical protein